MLDASWLAAVWSWIQALSGFGVAATAAGYIGSKLFERRMAEQVAEHQSRLALALAHHEGALEQQRAMQLADHAHEATKRLDDRRAMRNRSLDLLFDATMEYHRLATRALMALWPLHAPDGLVPPLKSGTHLDAAWECNRAYNEHFDAHEPLWPDELRENHRTIATYLVGRLVDYRSRGLESNLSLRDETLRQIQEETTSLREVLRACSSKIVHSENLTGVRQ